MTDIFLDPLTDDIAIDAQGRARLTASPEEDVRQLLRTRLRRFLGEWFLDTRLGVAYFRDVLIHAPNMSVIRALFMKEVSETPGVANVTKLELNWDTPTRLLNVELAVALDTGELLELTIGNPLTFLGTSVLEYDGAQGYFP